ncbi:MAG: OprO/OprP family phosphate-selective porin [Cytophagaceae bacterium]|nr:OprO/OprP family phosphate-selective porin [Cytophagaceae bacterium]
MKTFYFTLILWVVIGAGSTVYAQNEIKPTVSFKRGIGITTPDSSFSVNFRFRMQSRALYTTASENDLSAADIEARVRRLRLRMEGFMFNPKFTYLIQLSFSRGDMDWSVRDNSSVNVSPNVVRDAVVYYRVVKPLTLIFGQTKLPGNRQRVVSSGDLQFLDRSIVNATFNIDRDFGLQAYWTHHFGGFYYSIKSAISTGDGRNTNSSDAGLSYTGRLELLPLGEFTNKGDYFEGDLEREAKPKLSLAGGINYNEGARRTGGQIGNDLFSQRDITTVIFDGLFKFKGFALYGEYIGRTSEDPVTTSGTSTRFVTTGTGKLIQGSYIFKSNFEITGRYAIVTPESEVRNFVSQEQVATIGVNKYLRGHRLKLQSNLSFHDLKTYSNSSFRNFWSLGFQIEAGI